MSVDAGGCSGFQYAFELDDELDPEDDRIFSQDGVEVVTDLVSLSFLEVSHPVVPAGVPHRELQLTLSDMAGLLDRFQTGDGVVIVPSGG